MESRERGGLEHHDYGSGDIVATIARGLCIHASHGIFLALKQYQESQKDAWRSILHLIWLLFSHNDIVVCLL